MHKVFIGVVVTLVAIAISAIVVSGHTVPFEAGGESGVVGDAQTTNPPKAIPYIGIIITTLSKAKAQELGVVSGAVVQNVVTGSPAAGVLQKDDVILSLNGLNIITGADVTKLVRDSNVGDTLNLSVRRGTATLSLQVKVGSKELPAPQTKPNAKGIRPFFGGMMPRFGNLWKGEFTYGTDTGSKTVKMLGGTVKSVNASANTITITPKDGSADVTFTLDSASKVIGVGGINSLGQVKAGDPVSVTSVDGKVTVVVVGAQAPAGGAPKGPMPGGHFKGHGAIRGHMEAGPAGMGGMFNRLQSS